MSLGFVGFKITQKISFGTLQGVRGHAPPKKFKNGASQIG